MGKLIKDKKEVKFLGNICLIRQSLHHAEGGQYSHFQGRTHKEVYAKMYWLGRLSIANQLINKHEKAIER